MQVTIENVDKLTKRMRVVMPAAKVNAAVSEKLTGLKRNANIPGFRKGKVPESYFKKRFLEPVRREVVGTLINDSVKNAIETHALRPVHAPDISDLKMDGETDVEFYAQFEVYPDITLLPFDRYEIERLKIEVTDADLEKSIEKLRKHFRHFHEAVRPAAKGDRVIVDITTTVEGGSPETQKDAFIVLEDLDYMPGLLEGLLGKQGGDLVELDLRYPDTWPREEMRGKAYHVHALVKYVSEQHWADEDGVCKQLGIDPPSGEALRKGVRAKLEEELAYHVFERMKESLLEQLLADYQDIDLPARLIVEEQKALQRELAQTKRALSDAELQKESKDRTIFGIVINEIIQVKKVEVSREAEVKRVLREASRMADPSRFIAQYQKDKNFQDAIMRMVLIDKAVETILSESKLVDKPMTYEEAETLFGL